MYDVLQWKLLRSVKVWLINDKKKYNFINILHFFLKFDILFIAYVICNIKITWNAVSHASICWVLYGLYTV